MIPIECPKCGRGGSVPPDRLNARLVCKACHTVFHLDNTGRMAFGEPESFDTQAKDKKKAKEAAASIADFDLAQTWNDIPAPVKYGVPAIILVLLVYLNVDFGGAPAYQSSADSLIRAVASNNKSRAVSLSTPDSAAAADEWFEVVKGTMEKGQIGSDFIVNAGIFSGNPEKDSDMTLMVVVAKNGGADTITVMMPMRRAGGSWLLDATRGLESAKMAADTPKK